MIDDPSRVPYIVLRPAPGLGPGILDDDMIGQWYDREFIQVLGPDQTTVRLAGEVVFVAVATVRTEVDPERAPGHQVAQVWEVRP